MNRGAANFRIYEVRKLPTPLATGEFSNGASGEITGGGYTMTLSSHAILRFAAAPLAFDEVICGYDMTARVLFVSLIFRRLDTEDRWTIALLPDRETLRPHSGHQQKWRQTVVPSTLVGRIISQHQDSVRQALAKKLEEHRGAARMLAGQTIGAHYEANCVMLESVLRRWFG